MFDRAQAIAELTREVMAETSTADMIAYVRGMVYEGFATLTDEELLEQLEAYDIDTDFTKES